MQDYVIQYTDGDYVSRGPKGPGMWGGQWQKATRVHDAFRFPSRLYAEKMIGSALMKIMTVGEAYAEYFTRQNRLPEAVS